MNAPRHDVRYERGTLALLGIGFGLVGFDRWLLAPVFPHIMHDLGLNYSQLGSLIGILGVAWGLWSIAMGPLADRIGRKKILVTTMIAFSVLSSLSGLATGFLSLLLLRAAMGVAEGAFTPASIAANSEASLPARRGLNQGIQISMIPLMGLGFAPIVATQLLEIVPNWHWVFTLSAVPGFIVAALIWRYVRDRDMPASHMHMLSRESVVRPRWTELFASRNVVVATFAILCAMSGIFVIGAMVPMYLVSIVHLDMRSMGFVASAVGFGGFVGCFALAGISDYIGRRPMALIGFVCAAAFLYLFSHTGQNPTMLFVLLFGVALFATGLLSLLSGPIATEAAPVGLIASTIGFVSGVGETFGGGVAPVIAGFIAQHFGLAHTLDFALYSLAAGAVVAFFLLETAPRKRRHGAAQTQRSAENIHGVIAPNGDA
ncbi:MFS transporter [Paraburkholderia rhynchosiae]|uniref:MFS transporter n=1 Tax=Paraburkholderia rhynchosiae TaxID=487049 RepID=A0A2N7WIC8_9BURK|nr:MFS transporter [Paraburkholderia rhynchosiae]PMS29226.1 MFS transporter [Paraburkholderia rhynchosiae]CAB3743993.1 putative L-galactonate transporter [Paraburkholderia rhynchosiae]